VDSIRIIMLVGVAAVVLATAALLVFRQKGQRRHRTLVRLLDQADELERLLHHTRERMNAMKHLVGRVPSDIAAIANASLDADQRVKQGLRDVLEHRLWISRSAESASQKQLDEACAALQRAHAALASQLQRLESAGAELEDATAAAVEAAAREPAALTRRSGE
jgi:predicted  nucleic acid-binding Zn-ribbon protein